MHSLNSHEDRVLQKPLPPHFSPMNTLSGENLTRPFSFCRSSSVRPIQPRPDLAPATFPSPASAGSITAGVVVGVVHSGGFCSRFFCQFRRPAAVFPSLFVFVSVRRPGGRGNPTPLLVAAVGFRTHTPVPTWRRKPARLLQRQATQLSCVLTPAIKASHHRDSYSHLLPVPEVFRS